VYSAAVIALDEVQRRLHEFYIAEQGASLRREDETKAREVAALLDELARVRRDGLLVDAAAGKGYVGLLAVALLGFRRLRVLERDPRRIAACRAVRASLPAEADVDLREGDVGDPALWPERPSAVVALHACGGASDAVLDGAVRARARWLFLVPCCYGAGVPFAARAQVLMERLGVPRHAEVRRRALWALVDSERTLRLEAAGYETTVVPFVPPTVSPHNLLFRARYAGEGGRMRAAAEKLAVLTQG
jgi:hypothetical protein